MPVVTRSLSFGSRSRSGRGNAVRSRMATTASKSASRAATAPVSFRWSAKTTTSVPAGRLAQSAMRRATP